MRLHLLIFAISAFLGGFTSRAAHADVNEIQRLNFGTWYVPANNAVYDVSIALNGSNSHSPQLVMISPPVLGIYDIGGLTPSMTIVSIDAIQNTALTSGGNSFDMDSFVTSTSGSTSAGGRVTVTIGGTAHTTGLGGGYPTASYTGQIDLTFNY